MYFILRCGTNVCISMEFGSTVYNIAGKTINRSVEFEFRYVDLNLIAAVYSSLICFRGFLFLLLSLLLLLLFLMLVYIFSFTWNLSFFCVSAHKRFVLCMYVVSVLVINRFTEIQGNHIQRPIQRQLQQLLATSLDPVKKRKKNVKFKLVLHSTSVSTARKK